jgi:hypothetical protein
MKVKCPICGTMVDALDPENWQGKELCCPGKECIEFWKLKPAIIPTDVVDL